MEASESIPLGYKSLALSSTPLLDGFTSSFKIQDPLRLRPCKDTGHNSDITPLFLTWKLLVETYTRGGLTKETDKLVAISGLAKALAAQLGVEYLAGLWGDDYLAQQLG